MSETPTYEELVEEVGRTILADTPKEDIELFERVFRQRFNELLAEISQTVDEYYHQDG